MWPGNFVKILVGSQQREVARETSQHARSCTNRFGCHDYLFLELNVAFQSRRYFYLGMSQSHHSQQDRAQNQTKAMILYTAVSFF